jgi:trigger factor
VREKTLPELDDDFATTASEFDTIDELTKDVRDALLRRKVQSAQHELRGRIVEAYLALADVPLPPSMVEADKAARIQQVEQQAEQFGMDMEQLLEMQGTSGGVRGHRRGAGREHGEGAARARRLAVELDVDVETADIEAEINRHAQANNMPPQQIASIIQQQGSLPALIGDILRRKAIDEVVKAADVDGGPSEDVLHRARPRGPGEDEEEAEGEDGAGLIVPGEESGGDGDELIVPGKD